MIKSVVWTSMVDYPNTTTTVLFTGKCNFDCEYCYNKKLFNIKNMDLKKDILPKLLSRKDFIDTIVLSGGECTIEDDFDEIVDELYNNGFKIVVHTNGTMYDKISKNISKFIYVAIDYKTSDEKYNLITKRNVNLNVIKKTIKFVVDSNTDYEIRTTLYPVYINLDDCVEIAKTIKELGAKNYFLQQYKVTEDTPNIKSYSDEYIDKILIECNKILPTVLK